MKRLNPAVYFIASILLFACAKPPQRDSFTINDEMKPQKWAEFISVAVGAGEYWSIDSVFINPANEAKVVEYFRKVTPGTIVHLDCFIATQPAGTSSLMPLKYTFDIPVRQVNEKYGRLKSYEKDFLLTYLATNAKEIFTSTPTDTSLLKLWNFIMDNLWLTRNAEAGSLVKVKVDYRMLMTELLNNDPTFNTHLSPLNQRFQEVMLPRTSSASIKGFFEKSLPPTVNTPKFYYGDDLTDRFYSFVSFAAIVDGVYYNTNQVTQQLSTWSLYDWIHSGVPLYDTSRGKRKTLKYVVFNQHSGRYRILNNATSAGWDVRYQSKNAILHGRGNKKTITEEDLVNIFPSGVKRLIFK